MWRQIPHDGFYTDRANVNDAHQERNFKTAQRSLQQYEHLTELVFLRNFTSEAVHYIEDNSLDFVFIDARHDMCSVAEDIELYWPKLREGGILAGHDYMMGRALHEFVDTTDSYEICPNGDWKFRSVKGAVDDFAAKHGLQVAITYGDITPWLSWIIRKPCGSSLSLSSSVSGIHRTPHTKSHSKSQLEL